MNTYEIYVYNDRDIKEGVYKGSKKGTVSGWEIRYVMTNRDIKEYPLFDCVITKNDVTYADCEMFQ